MLLNKTLKPYFFINERKIQNNEFKIKIITLYYKDLMNLITK